ncbi:sporulation protein [Peptostreptococcaceae bacterium AGR-M142]
MGFFNNLTDSLGFGGTKVDAKLSNDMVRQGDLIEGVIEIKGGKVKRVIDNVYLKLNTLCEKESDDKTIKVSETIQELKIDTNITINPKEIKTFPFEFKVSNNAPISTSRFQTWMSTSLDIKSAIDPSDKDYIKVVPNEKLQRVIEIIEHLGFRINEIDNEYTNSNNRPHRYNFIQEIEFKPSSNSIYRGRLNEVEIVSSSTDDGILIRFEIDRKAKGLRGFFMELTNTDEKLTSIFIENESLNNINYVASLIKDRIDRNL